MCFFKIALMRIVTAEVKNVPLTMPLLLFPCYWVSQPLQQLKNCDRSDSSMLTRLQ